MILKIFLIVCVNIDKILDKSLHFIYNNVIYLNET